MYPKIFHHVNTTQANKSFGLSLFYPCSHPVRPARKSRLIVNKWRWNIFYKEKQFGRNILQGKE